MNDLTSPGSGSGPAEHPPSGPSPGSLYAPRPPNGNGRSVDDSFLTLREVLGVLRRSVWLIVAGGVLGVGATIGLLSIETPMYRANALIRLTDARGALAGPIGIAPQRQVASNVDPVLSEIMVLRGRGVLGTVVEREGLRLTDPEHGAAPAWLSEARVDLPPESTRQVHLSFGPERWTLAVGEAVAATAYGSSAAMDGLEMTVSARPEREEALLAVVSRDVAIDRLLEDLTVRARRGTDGIDVSVVSPDPAAAERVVNAVVHVYQEVNARTNQQRATRRRMFLEDQLQSTDSRLIGAQAALSDFRSRKQVYSSREKLAAQQSAVLEIDMRRKELDADRRTYRSLLDGLESRRLAGEEPDLASLVALPGIASNPVISQLYGQLASYQAARDSSTTGLWARAETHPDVERLDRLITTTEGRLIEAVESHIASLDARIAELGGLRERNAVELGALPEAEAQEARLAQQVTSLQTMADELRSEYQKARVEEAVETGDVEIVSLASRSSPLSNRRGLKLFLGSLIGLTLGASGGFLREHLDDAIVHEDQMEAVLRVPSLAVIPEIVASSGELQPPVVGEVVPGENGHGGKKRFRTRQDADRHRSAAGDYSYTAGAEAYRKLRTNLIFSKAVQRLGSLVVTSACPAEGKTITVANLGVAFASQGIKVLLVDSDLRRPDLAKTFGFPKAPGLTDVLVGEIGLAEAIRSTGRTGLDVLPPGKLPPNPSELVGGRRMEELVRDLSEHYDILILDSPPLLAASDAAVLGSIADGVLMVVRAGYTDSNAADDAMEQLANVGARTVGAVLNDPDANVQRYGYYYQYAYYAEPVDA